MVLADEIEEPGRSRGKGHADLISKRAGFGSVTTNESCRRKRAGDLPLERKADTIHSRGGKEQGPSKL